MPVDGSAAFCSGAPGLNNARSVGAVPNGGARRAHTPQRPIRAIPRAAPSAIGQAQHERDAVGDAEQRHERHPRACGMVCEPAGHAPQD